MMSLYVTIIVGIVMGVVCNRVKLWYARREMNKWLELEAGH